MKYVRRQGVQPNLRGYIVLDVHIDVREVIIDASVVAEVMFYCIIITIQEFTSINVQQHYTATIMQ